MLVFASMIFDVITYIFLFAALYFEVFLLLSFMEAKEFSLQKNAEKIPENSLPTVTIAVPCYNEEKTLAKTVKSLLDLNYPKNKLNIYIVNDGSKDNTLKIARNLAKKHKTIKVFNKKNGGKASAMNLALKHSESELIGCLDADSFVAKNALLHIARKFISDKSIKAVTPAIMVHNPSNILQYIQKTEYMIGIFVRKTFGILNSIIITPGPFSIFKREDMVQLGGWKHAHGTEDYEIGLRFQNNHKRIANEPLAHVYTIAPDTLRKLYLQRVRWVYGFIMNTADYKHMIGNKKYGAVGLLVLPAAIASIAGAIYLFIFAIWNMLYKLYEMYIKLSVSGISLTAPAIDLFYINTDAILFITAIIIIATLTVLHISAKLSTIKNADAKDVILYLALYGFIAPIWITGATLRAALKKESEWKVLR